MSQSVGQLLNAALALPEQDQLQLLSALASALEEKGVRPFDESWLEEVQRRSAEIDAGTAQGIPWSEVKEQARKKRPQCG